MEDMKLTVKAEGAVVVLRVPLAEGGTNVAADMPPKEARELAWALLKAAALSTWNIVTGVL